MKYEIMFLRPLSLFIKYISYNLDECAVKLHSRIGTYYFIAIRNDLHC